MVKNKLFAAMLLCVTILLTAGILLTAIHPSIRAAGTMPSYGTAGMKVIDISQYNDSIGTNSDNIDFEALNTQVDAVYIRAFGNRGTGYYIDEQAANYAASCQISGLKFSFYDYFIPTADTADAVAEARAYYNFIKNFGFSCVPALDVEDNRNELSKGQLAASVKAFQDEFKALSGFNLMVYSYPYFMKDNFDTSFDWTQYKLWIAHYGVSAPMEGISSSWFPTSLWCWSYWDMWQYTSTYIGTAPSSGDLTLTVQMLKEGVCWFGSRQTVTVKQQDAKIVSVTAPAALLIGQTQNLTVTMKNTGLTPWKADEKFRLATSDARGIMPAGTVIAPGGTYTFTVKETAPLTTGTKSLKLQMVIEGKAYFGEKQYLSIPVKKPAASEITASTIPAALIAGTKYTVSVTIKNTDNVTWNSTANLKLGLKLDGKDAGRVASLPAGIEIKPGESYVFTGSFTPAAAGTYTFQLLQEGVSWFGSSTSATASVT